MKNQKFGPNVRYRCWFHAGLFGFSLKSQKSQKGQKVGQVRKVRKIMCWYYALHQQNGNCHITRRTNILAQPQQCSNPEPWLENFLVQKPFSERGDIRNYFGGQKIISPTSLHLGIFVGIFCKRDLKSTRRDPFFGIFCKMDH